MTTQDTTTKKSAYHEEKEGQLRAMESRIDKLVAKLEASGDKAKAKYTEEMATLRQKKDALASSLHKLKNAGDDA